MEETKKKTDLSGGVKILMAVKTAHGKERGTSGVMPCPNCRGTVEYSIAKSNGHVHARCTLCDVWIME